METEQSAAVVINEEDNVATAIREIKAGDRVMVVGGVRSEVEVKNHIRFLHKFAIRDIKKGETVTKYGQSIGEATADILEGEHVHIHNLRSLRGHAKA